VKLVIVTGMSGAGKSTVMKMMEDMDFFCVDNLPIPLFEKFVELLLSSHITKKNVAVGVDVRSGDDFLDFRHVLDSMDQKSVSYEILFMEADTETLVKRYKETRRSHPLAKEERIDKGIELERGKIGFIRKRSNYILDTSNLLTRELKAELERIFIKEEEFKSLFITVLSFGFKYGIPSDSDMVMDVRFLPNPYYDPALRPKTGNDEEIRSFVLKYEEANIFINKLEDMVRFLIPQYISEGKTNLVISIGCTGGKHRSVTLANELFKRLEGGQEYGLKIEHRDIGKDVLRGK
jgi:UPF0042 nucleotide-binding protein